MGGAEAFERGFSAELVPLFFAAADPIAEECAGAGNPGALEGMDDDAGRIAEDRVVEGEGGPAGREF